MLETHRGGWRFLAGGLRVPVRRVALGQALGVALAVTLWPAIVAAEARNGLTREQALEAIGDRLEQLRAQPPRDGLEVELPAGLDELMAAADEDGRRRMSLRVLTLPVGDHSMPYAVLRKPGPGSGGADAAAEDGHALFICMHGGGQNADADGPHAWPVNSREFQAQIGLVMQAYEPGGIYLVPRMADDRLGRWWHRHHQQAFDAVIDHAILHWGVSPDRVYLLGVSEGGYGAAILAPWMADRLAGANAMAAGVGLANPPANLRNLAFRSDVGENDRMFDRAAMAVAFHEELERLRGERHDAEAYRHAIGVQAGRGHGIDYRPGVSWIAGHTREPWPARVVWIDQTLDGVRRDRFYWLARPERDPEATDDVRLVAEADRETGTITLEAHRLEGRNTDGNRTHGMDDVATSGREPLSGEAIELLLADGLVDLDRELTVICNGEAVFTGRIPRSPEVIERELGRRPDPSQCPAAALRITVP